MPINFLDYLEEQPERQRSRTKPEQERTKTRTRERPDLSAFERDPSAGRQAPAPHKPEREVTTPELKKADVAKTGRAVSDIEASPEVMDKLAGLMGSDLRDVVSDEEAAKIAGATRTPGFSEPKEKTKAIARIGSLPKVINKKMAKEGMVEPDWHQVKHLPGYMVNAIRAIGRAVFTPFTDTPIEKIQVVANVGKGPNSVREVDAVLAWLHKHARRDTEAELWFEDQIPDYDAKVICYKASGYTFLAVKDFAGNYIYSWPTNDEKELTQHHWDD